MGEKFKAKNPDWQRLPSWVQDYLDVGENTDSPLIIETFITRNDIGDKKATAILKRGSNEISISADSEQAQYEIGIRLEDKIRNASLSINTVDKKLYFDTLDPNGFLPKEKRTAEQLHRMKPAEIMHNVGLICDFAQAEIYRSVTGH